jgi:hypothetical protein
MGSSDLLTGQLRESGEQLRQEAVEIWARLQAAIEDCRQKLEQARQL